MKTVYTKEELKRALEDKENRVLVKGEYANQIKKRIKTGKIGCWVGAGLLAVGAIAAIPFTGGASIGAYVSGLTATVGGVTVVMSATELAMVLGFGSLVAGAAMLKEYSVVVTKDGEVYVGKKEKK